MQACLGNVMSKVCTDDIEMGVASLGLSGIACNTTIIQEQKQNITFRVTKEQNIDLLRSRLSLVNWFYTLSMEMDASENCCMFINLLSEIFNEC